MGVVSQAVLSEGSRKLFDSIKRQQASGGPGGSPGGAAQLQGLAGVLSMMRPPPSVPSPAARTSPQAGAATSPGGEAAERPAAGPGPGPAAGLMPMLAPALQQFQVRTHSRACTATREIDTLTLG